MDHRSVSDDEMDNRFTYHKPKGDQVKRYQRIRTAARTLAELLNEECPPSREKSVACTYLETAMFWANAAIARNE